MEQAAVEVVEQEIKLENVAEQAAAAVQWRGRVFLRMLCQLRWTL